MDKEPVHEVQVWHMGSLGRVQLTEFLDKESLDRFRAVVHREMPDGGGSPFGSIKRIEVTILAKFQRDRIYDTLIREAVATEGRQVSEVQGEEE